MHKELSGRTGLKWICEKILLHLSLYIRRLTVALVPNHCGEKKLRPLAVVLRFEAPHFANRDSPRFAFFSQSHIVVFSHND